MKFYFLTIIILVNLQLYGNNPLNQELGRDSDPKTIEEISKLKIFTKKSIWTLLSLPGMRTMSDIIFPNSVISYIQTDKKIVAFTIDDGFCGRDNPTGDMLLDVIKLFEKYNAKATFFVTGTHCNHTDIENIQLLIDSGHEIANHSMYDWPYDKYSLEDFGKDFQQTDSILSQYSDNIPKYYRAPHAKVSKTMTEFLENNGYTHIMCDGFANDTSIPDAKWISRFIVNRIKPGSILLIHMPEKGIREWNYEAIELTLSKLNKDGYKIVTISELLLNSTKN